MLQSLDLGRPMRRASHAPPDVLPPVPSFLPDPDPEAGAGTGGGTLTRAALGFAAWTMLPAGLILGRGTTRLVVAGRVRAACGRSAIATVFTTRGPDRHAGPRAEVRHDR